MISVTTQSAESHTRQPPDRAFITTSPPFTQDQSAGSHIARAHCASTLHNFTCFSTQLLQEAPPGFAGMVPEGRHFSSATFRSSECPRHLPVWLAVSNVILLETRSISLTARGWSRRVLRARRARRCPTHGWPNPTPWLYGIKLSISHSI